jgi:hypothetical protein
MTHSDRYNNNPKGIPMKLPLVTSLTLLSVLSACSSIIEGTNQEITVNTNPSGANCSLERQGMSIARVEPTPGAATIKKTKYDIIIYCNKEGYQEASYLNHSGAAGATFGNIVLGGGIGWAVDSAAGADNKYDSPVNITLVPEENGKHSKKSGHHHTSVPVAPQQDNASDADQSKEWPTSSKR